MRQPVSHLRSEAEYCHQLDVELTDTLRTRTILQERHHRLEELLQVREPAIFKKLERLGYDETTVTLLFVVPLVQVAWADGSVTKPERDHIVAIATLRGIKPNTPAYERLMAWLEREPSNEFFEGTLDVIAAVISSLPASEREQCKRALLLVCHDAAEAPCHVFGQLSRVCAAKRKAIEGIRNRLEQKDQLRG